MRWQEVDQKFKIILGYTVPDQSGIRETLIFKKFKKFLATFEI